MTNTAQKLSIHQKLVEIRKNIDAFSKDKAGYGYNYVSGSQVLGKIKDKMDELHVLLVTQIGDIKHEVFSYTKMKKYDNQWKEETLHDFLVYGSMTMKWVNAENPSDIIEIPWFTLGQQDDISKAFGSGLTYSERYFLLKFFGVPTDEDDPDAKLPKSYGQSENKNKSQRYGNNQPTGSKSRSNSGHPQNSGQASGNKLGSSGAVPNFNQARAKAGEIGWDVDIMMQFINEKRREQGEGEAGKWNDLPDNWKRGVYKKMVELEIQQRHGG